MDWRKVPGFPMYEVNRQGEVRSAPRTYIRGDWRHGHQQRVHWRGGTIKGWVRKQNGKPSAVLVALRRNNETFTERIHRLVLLAFVGPCPPGAEGCHNNGNPLDNRLSNLRWDTHAENIADSVRHQTKTAPPIHKGESHPRARLADADVVAIRAVPRTRGSDARLARQFNVSATTIARIRTFQQR